MSDLGEKTCPLCAEEMDLTDQHLKPCKCGYEICVWCWHQIMDMAEKNDSDGRCPACRAPYNKEKIVGTASNCERLVAEMNTEKKLKSNKGKSKTTSEARKHLTSVRVIQKNLVYLVGLPLNLADEDLLQHKEYFGQYGKVLKVSISRTSTGAIQHFANNTCSVYITYSKEEEAVCCIQSVHEFILEGRQLKACFGTTKYCHAWLRNMPCINPDCLYLHEFGSEEDRFSKDEAVSAFSRNRVQQVMSVANSAQQRRSGNVLPPPADEYLNNGCASPEKPISKSTTINNTTCSMKISPPNSSSGRSVALPAGASWGARSSNHQPTSGNLLTTSNGGDGLHKQKVDGLKSPATFSAAVVSSNHIASPHNDGPKKLCEEEETKPAVGKEHAVVDSRAHAASVLRVSPRRTKREHFKKVDSGGGPDFYGSYKCSSLPSDITVSSESCETTKPVDDDQKHELDHKIKDTRSDTSSMCLARNQGPIDGVDGCKEVAAENEVSTAQNKSYIRPDSVTSVVEAALSEDINDRLSYDDQRFNDPIEVTSNGTYSTDVLHTPSSELSNVKKDSKFVDKRVLHSISQSSGTPVLLSGYRENESIIVASPPTKNIEDPYLSSVDDRTLNMRRFGSKGTSIDMGENTIISGILSLDLDSLDESLSSQNFAKFLGENDIKQGTHNLPSPWKSQHSNQSRFSFAREEEVEESMHPAPRFASPVDYTDHAARPRSFVHDQYESRNFKLDKFSSQNGFGFSPVNGEEHDLYNGFDSRFGSDNLAVSRSQIAAPPGFSTPKRAAAPPGFTSYERMGQPADNPLYGNYTMDVSSFLPPSHQYQIPQAGNVVCNGDVEFIDPAILAVGKGRVPDGGFNGGVGLDLRSRFSPHFNTSYETNARPQLLMQRSSSHLQNHQGYDIGVDRYSSPNDSSFRIPSRVVEQSIGGQNNMSPYSGVGGLTQSRSGGGHWDTWRDIQNGNNMAMAADLLRAERLGFNKFHTGYEDSALRMPSQGDLYNRTFGF